MKAIPQQALVGLGVLVLIIGISTTYERYRGTDLSRVPLLHAAAVGGWQFISETGQRALLDSLAETFDDPAAAGIDWDVLRESKQLAWPAR